MHEDVPRIANGYGTYTALLGDPRNDENVIIAGLPCAHASWASAEPSNATAIIRISRRSRQAWPRGAIATAQGPPLSNRSPTDPSSTRPTHPCARSQRRSGQRARPLPSRAIHGTGELEGSKRRSTWRPGPARSARSRTGAPERPGRHALGSDIQGGRITQEVHVASGSASSLMKTCGFSSFWMGDRASVIVARPG